MVNYNNSKVYKIVGPGDMIYIGSTTKNYLSSRLSEHRSCYKTRNTGIKKGKCSSYQIFDAYGPENCNIYLLEIVNCDTKNELLARERHHIETIECINKIIPGRTQKEHYNINREVKLEKQKEYYNDNKDAIIEYQKAYKDANRDIIREKAKTKCVCNICGGKYTNASKAKHFKTKQHLNAVAAVVPDLLLSNSISDQPPV